MLDAIIIMFERLLCNKRRINVHTLDLTCDLAGEFGLQGLQGEQVIPEDEAVVEEVVVSHAVRRMVGLIRVLQQNTRLQLRPVLLADPRQFKSLIVLHEGLSSCGGFNAK